MGHSLTAQELLPDLSARLGLSESVTRRIFSDVPTDFRVMIRHWLPFGVHRMGMGGITLFGRVWLHSSVRRLPSERLLLLLRHEATHIRQQRAQPIGFYFRYGIDWIAGVIGLTSLTLDDREDPRVLSRWMRAYYAIPFEREAYREEARARSIVHAYLQPSP